MAELETVSVLGLPQGNTLTGNDQVPVHQNGRLVRVRVGDLYGGGGMVERVAAVAMAARTVVVEDGAQMRPADPSDLAHCGRVIGILPVAVARGISARVQTSGSVAGLTVPGSAGAAFYPGAGGSIVRTPPPWSLWRQVVARSDAVGGVLVGLGDPSLIGYASVLDTDYQCLATDRQIGMRTLTAPRTIRLPDVDSFAFAEPLVVADESGDCSEERPIEIAPGLGTGDKIGLVAATALRLTDAYAVARFIRGAANLWIPMR